MDIEIEEWKADTHVPGTLPQIMASSGWHGNGYLVAQVPDCCEEERMIRNQHLLSAAMDLYAVCEKLCDHLDGCSHGYPDELWDEAQAALSKARGES